MPGNNLPAGLAGRALSSMLAPSASDWATRRTGRALKQLHQEQVAAEAAVHARVELIESATRASLESSAVIWSEAESLAAVAPSAGPALQQIANASTVGLMNVVVDTSR